VVFYNWVVDESVLWLTIQAEHIDFKAGNGAGLLGRIRDTFAIRCDGPLNRGALSWDYVRVGSTHVHDGKPAVPTKDHPVGMGGIPAFASLVSTRMRLLRIDSKVEA
jgi:hypothetical protein